MKRWVAWGLVGVLMEFWALRRERWDSTLSHATRRCCQVDKKWGRRAFMWGWAGLTFWLLPHILGDVDESDAM